MAVSWKPNTRSAKQIYSVLKVSMNSQDQNHSPNSLTFNKTNATPVLQQPSYKDINAHATKLFFSGQKSVFLRNAGAIGQGNSLTSECCFPCWLIKAQEMGTARAGRPCRHGEFRDTGHYQQTLMFLCVPFQKREGCLTSVDIMNLWIIYSELLYGSLGDCGMFLMNCCATCYAQ